TCGVHPDEHPGPYIYEGAVEAIREDTALGSALRSAFTFYCYPRINAQGLYAGLKRIDPQNNRDGNRVWDDPEDSEMVSLYRDAWDADFGDTALVSFDFHSWPSFNPA